MKNFITKYGLLILMLGVTFPAFGMLWSGDSSSESLDIIDSGSSSSSSDDEADCAQSVRSDQMGKVGTLYELELAWGTVVFEGRDNRIDTNGCSSSATRGIILAPHLETSLFNQWVLYWKALKALLLCESSYASKIEFESRVKEVVLGLQELARLKVAAPEASSKFSNDIYTLFGFGVDNGT